MHLPCVILVVETAQVENAQSAIAEQQDCNKILQHGVPNIQAGIKHAANVLSHMKVEEMLINKIRILMDLMMLDYGRLIILTGVDVTMDMLHVTLIKILTVLLRYINGLEIHGRLGLLQLDVDADLFNHVYVE